MYTFSIVYFRRRKDTIGKYVVTIGIKTVYEAAVMGEDGEGKYLTTSFFSSTGLIGGGFH